MIIDLKTWKEDEPDGFLLGRVDWKVIPRKGEYVVLEGIVCQADRAKSHGDRSQDNETFVVEDIVYKTDLDGEWLLVNDQPAVIHMPNVEVWLRINERIWVGTEESDA